MCQAPWSPVFYVIHLSFSAKNLWGHAERTWPKEFSENFDDCHICCGPTGAIHQGEIASRTSWYTQIPWGCFGTNQASWPFKDAWQNDFGRRGHGRFGIFDGMLLGVINISMCKTPCYAAMLILCLLVNCVSIFLRNSTLRMMNGDYASSPGFYWCFINFSMLAVNISGVRCGFNSFLSVICSGASFWHLHLGAQRWNGVVVQVLDAWESSWGDDGWEVTWNQSLWT